MEDNPDSEDFAAKFKMLAANPANLPQILAAVDGSGLDELFKLYSEKMDELRIIEESLATTTKARRMIEEMVSGLTAANDNVPPARLEVVNLEKEIMRRLNAAPEQLHQLQPRQFEEVICALLSDMGLDIHLTPQTHDGGRDILAVAHTQLGELLTIVECKRYRPDRHISVNQIRSLLFTVRDADRASCGLLATTSYFSKEAINLAADYAFQMKLRDFDAIREWIGRYGTWTETKRGGFWFPSQSKMLIQ